MTNPVNSLPGPIIEQHEGWQPPGPESQFSDSFYFGLADDSGLGLYTRIGWRPNESIIEGALGIYLPDGRYAMLWNRSAGPASSSVKAGPLHYSCDLPFKRWRLEAEGSGRMFEQATDLLLAPDRFEEVTIALSLSFEAWAGPIAFMGSATDAAASQNLERGVARYHYEQPGMAAGSITVGGESYEGRLLRGMRDHSWGVRDWQAIVFWRWACASFGPDLAIGVSNVGRRDGGVDVGGWVLQDGWLSPVEQCSWSSKMDEAHDWQRGLIIDVVDVAGRSVRLEGEALAVAPLRQRRRELVTCINEALTRYTLDGRTTYGISEYLIQS